MKNIFFLLLILFLNVDCIIFNSDYKIENREKFESEKFHELLSEQWEQGIVNSPEWATRLGDNRFNDQLNYDLYLHRIKKQIEGFQFLSYLIPIDQMGGIQIGFAGVSNYMLFNNVKNYENCLTQF